MTATPDKLTVSSWLAELRMECYKKHLEDYETIKQLLDLKEMEQKLKKLGVGNSKDRARMMGSLATFRKDPPPHPSPVANVQLQEKTLSRKGSTRKLKLKSLLSSSSSKKSKKKTDNFSTPVPATVHVSEISSPPQSPSPLTKSKLQSSITDDYEEVPDLSPRSRAMTLDGKPYQNWKVVENEYVPSPDKSPNFSEQRFRSNTVANFDRQTETSPPFSRPPSGDIQYRNRLDVGKKEDSPGALKHRHLSGASMESGLSFGYDVEKDFNPSLPLESQPWFRGRISRADAEAALNEDGDFIVRESTAILNTYTLSLHWRGAYDHTMVNTTEVVNTTGDIRKATGVKYHFESGAFDTIPELIFNHLKYQIPIDLAQHTLITNPICRPGASNHSTPNSMHRGIYTTQQSYAHPPHVADPNNAQNFSTLPRNFGRKTSVCSLPEETANGSQTLTRGTPNPSARYRHNKLSNSSGDLLDDKPSHNHNYRGMMSPPPIAEIRTRAMTTDSRSRQTNVTDSPHQRQESFGDYVAMGSVSICGDSDSLDEQEEYRKSTPPSQHQKSSTKVSNYADVVCLKDQIKPALTINDDAVKYAEVRFAQKKKSPQSSRESSPYQSRADYLAGRAPREVSNYAQIKFDDSSPHPFSQYASIQRNSSPNVLTSRDTSPRQRSQTEAHIYARSEKPRNKKLDRSSTASNDSALSTTSSQSSNSNSSTPQPPTTPQSTLLLHSHAPSAKVHRDLPGYEALVKVHTILQSHSNKQLVYHLTRADAVNFLLSPRPGEEDSVWRDRVNKTTSSSGMYTGLQTLADTDGEKLWKKLYNRHLSLSQTVTLCVITAGDALERTKLLHRFIEIATLLQSGKFGNLYAFISVIQGINVPQITDMVDIWDLLKSHFPASFAAHKDLLSVISNLNEGIAMFSTEHLTIPAIQHLKTVFHYSEPSIPGYNTVVEDRSLIGEYWSMACGLDGIRTIMSHTSHFSFNARKKLEGRKYDAALMDFFLGDFTRVYLQSIGVHCDDPMERRRKFGIVMEGLVARVEAGESV